MRHPSDWVRVTGRGVHIEPADVHVDPVRPVDRALITHGHGDHARPGHGSVLATPETIAIMKTRYGANAARHFQPVSYGETVSMGDVEVAVFPAGHVLGSAQFRVSHGGARIVFSGDYKRAADPTCTPFEPVECDVFVTEATFALPVFRHPLAAGEIERLLASLRLFPERTHVVGTYALGKCQRLIRHLRLAGYDRPIYLHGALVNLCELYEALGVPLGPLKPATGLAPGELAGQIVLAPPSAIADRWARRLVDPVVTMASGWMRVRQRARQSGVELPLVISDHADWDELLATVGEVAQEAVWVTHGREEALIHEVRKSGLDARALALVGFEEEGE